MTDCKTNNAGRKAIVLIILLFVLVIGLGTGIVAKYIYDNTGENIFAAKEFYFTSDLLEVNEKEYLLNSNTTEVSFTLGNNADGLRFSDDTVNFTVTATGGTLDVNQGQLAGGEISEKKITLSGLEKGRTYIVTATANTKNTGSDDEIGYTKVLKARFKIADDDKYVYTHVETDALQNTYVLLTVWTGNVSGNVSIKYDGKDLIPDTTDPMLKDIYNFTDNRYDSFNVSDNENFGDTYQSRTYRFFLDKNTSPDLLKNITETTFTVTLYDGTTTYLASAGTL